MYILYMYTYNNYNRHVHNTQYNVHSIQHVHNTYVHSIQHMYIIHMYTAYMLYLIYMYIAYNMYTPQNRKSTCIYIYTCKQQI